jgi:hypothetical protein
VSKYGAQRTEIDGITFDSKAEAKRYADLRLLERGGQISDLKMQPEFPFRLNGGLIFTYRADFSYRQGVCLVIEDVKGFDTPVSKLKRKIIEADSGLTIRCVDAHGNSIKPRSTRKRRARK